MQWRRQEQQRGLSYGACNNNDKTKEDEQDAPFNNNGHDDSFRSHNHGSRATATATGQ